MNQVTTPLRLPADEYKKYRKLALEQGKSFAAFVREALRGYGKTGDNQEAIRRRAAAAKRLWENRIPIDVPIKDLIREGRRFDDEEDYSS